MISLSIPTIDINRRHESPPPSSLVADIRDACETWGFFQVVGHGIPRADVDRFFATAAAFFALDTATKRRVERTDVNPWGFYDRELTKNRQDWKEIFDFGIAQDDARFPSRPQWPADPAFCAVMMAWFDRCTTLSHELLQLILLALDEAPDRLDGAFEAHSSYQRLNYYPVCDDPAAEDSPTDPDEGQLGISHHTDAGALTVLAQTRLASLQVWHRDAWHTVQPEEDGLIINIGDMVQVWSNDRFRAPLHRVLANAQSTRFSAPYFYNPAFDADVAPLSGTPHYTPVNWGEFRHLRAQGDYADYGEEVQISRYRAATGRSVPSMETRSP